MHIMLQHYGDFIMGVIASQIISLTIVYSTSYSDADQRKHQSSASLAFVWGIHRDRWIPRTNGQLRGKCFHLMTSSWSLIIETIIQKYGEVNNPLVSSLLCLCSYSPINKCLWGDVFDLCLVVKRLLSLSLQLGWRQLCTSGTANTGLHHLIVL